MQQFPYTTNLDIKFNHLQKIDIPQLVEAYHQRGTIITSQLPLLHKKV